MTNIDRIREIITARADKLHAAVPHMDRADAERQMTAQVAQELRGVYELELTLAAGALTSAEQRRRLAEREAGEILRDIQAINKTWPGAGWNISVRDAIERLGTTPPTGYQWMSREPTDEDTDPARMRTQDLARRHLESEDTDEEGYEAPYLAELYWRLPGLRALRRAIREAWQAAVNAEPFDPATLPDESPVAAALWKTYWRWVEEAANRPDFSRADYR